MVESSPPMSEAKQSASREQKKTDSAVAAVYAAVIASTEGEASIAEESTLKNTYRLALRCLEISQEPVGIMFNLITVAIAMEGLERGTMRYLELPQSERKNPAEQILGYFAETAAELAAESTHAVITAATGNANPFDINDIISKAREELKKKGTIVDRSCATEHNDNATTVTHGNLSQTAASSTADVDENLERVCDKVAARMQSMVPNINKMAKSTENVALVHAKYLLQSQEFMLDLAQLSKAPTVAPASAEPAPTPPVPQTPAS